jgi:hypothetical protein
MLIQKISYRDSRILENGIEIVFFFKDDEQSVLAFMQSDFYLVNKSTKSDFSDFKVLDYSQELEIINIKEHYDKDFKYFITFTNGNIMVIYFEFHTGFESSVQSFEIVKKNDQNEHLNGLDNAKEVTILDLRFLPQS